MSESTFVMKGTKNMVKTVGTVVYCSKFVVFESIYEDNRSTKIALIFVLILSLPYSNLKETL